MPVSDVTDADPFASVATAFRSPATMRGSRRRISPLTSRTSPSITGSSRAPVTARRVSTRPAVVMSPLPMNGVSSRASSVPFARTAACRSLRWTCPSSSNDVPSPSHFQLSMRANPSLATTRVGITCLSGTSATERSRRSEEQFALHVLELQRRGRHVQLRVEGTGDLTERSRVDKRFQHGGGHAVCDRLEGSRSITGRRRATSQQSQRRLTSRRDVRAVIAAGEITQLEKAVLEVRADLKGFDWRQVGARLNSAWTNLEVGRIRGSLERSSDARQQRDRPVAGGD